MTPALEGEFAAFARYRSAPLNVHRRGSACTTRTAECDRSVLMQFFAWLHRQRGGNLTFGGVFSDAGVARMVQAYLKHCRDRGVKWTTCARRVASYLAAARFVHAAQQAQAPSNVLISTTAIDQLTRLHLQAKKSAREESKFSLSKKQGNWLTWADVQRARCVFSIEHVILSPARNCHLYRTCTHRVKAKLALADYTGNSKAKRLQLLRDVCFLQIVTSQPPDRGKQYTHPRVVPSNPHPSSHNSIRQPSQWVL